MTIYETEMLQVMEKHCKEYSPYEVYLRSMYELFKSHEETVSEWEKHDSVMYKTLSQYQKDGYNSLVDIAERYSGVFLCDGVGLGKTFVGMMLTKQHVIIDVITGLLAAVLSVSVGVWIQQMI